MLFLINANSPMGSNLSFLLSKHGINFQSHSLAHSIKVTTTVEQLDSQSTGACPGGGGKGPGPPLEIEKQKKKKKKRSSKQILSYFTYILLLF